MEQDTRQNPQFPCLFLLLCMLNNIFCCR